MNRDHIKDAIENAVPFTIRMADGIEHHVPHSDYISLPPKGNLVIVYDDKGRFSMLPMRTMTALTGMTSRSDDPPGT